VYLLFVVEMVFLDANVVQLGRKPEQVPVLPPNHARHHITTNLWVSKIACELFVKDNTLFFRHKAVNDISVTSASGQVHSYLGSKRRGDGEAPAPFPLQLGDTIEFASTNKNGSLCYRLIKFEPQNYAKVKTVVDGHLQISSSIAQDAPAIEAASAVEPAPHPHQAAPAQVSSSLSSSSASPKSSAASSAYTLEDDGFEITGFKLADDDNASNSDDDAMDEDEYEPDADYDCLPESLVC
jgi:hypothetical protein